MASKPSRSGRRPPPARGLPLDLATACLCAFFISHFLPLPRWRSRIPGGARAKPRWEQGAAHGMLPGGRRRVHALARAAFPWSPLSPCLLSTILGALSSLCSASTPLGTGGWRTRQRERSPTCWVISSTGSEFVQWASHRGCERVPSLMSFWCQ